MRRGEYLDSNLFVEVLALCALSCKAFSDNDDTIGAIIRFIDKITQSKGSVNAKKMIGNTRVSLGDTDPLLSIRQRYSEYFDDKSRLNNSEYILNEALN